MAKQAAERPVQEIKPVAKTWLWCLAIVPFVASMIAGPFAIAVFPLSSVLFLFLDQRAIKKSGRKGDGGLWYFLVLFVSFICIPVYLFCSGKDTKRGRAPGFVYLALLAASLPFVLSSGGAAEEDDAAAPRRKTEKRVSASSVRTILQKAKRAEEAGNVNLCGFYVGMDRDDAETLVKHYRIADDDFSFIGDPVWSLMFTLEGIRRITNGGNTTEELLQSVANQIGDFEGDGRGGYHYRTIDGFHVSMSRLTGIVKMFGPTIDRAREKIVASASTRDIKNLLSGMVRIPGKPFLMGRFEVTQAQWAAVMGNNPSGFPEAGLPVESVSWDDCQVFLEKLNALPEAKKSGMKFRLPTEEEWAYACQAGSTGDYCLLADGTEIVEDSLELVAWFKDNSNRSTHPVGQKKPNAFGLYDMYGNVGEWIDTAVGRYKSRGFRGGGWSNSASGCKTSNRHHESPNFRDSDLGFRLCAETEADRRNREAERGKVISEIVSEIVSGMVRIPGKHCRFGQYEVTQAQWVAVMGNNPSKFYGPDLPVENVSWDDCQVFLEKLNALPEAKKSGMEFRLPTKNEWEYACQAGAGVGAWCLIADGTKIQFNTIDRVAWFKDNSNRSTHPVGQKEPNAFGLYDMYGNVAELTSTAEGKSDGWRGYSWEDSLWSSFEDGGDPSCRGFRLCASDRAD